VLGGLVFWLALGVPFVFMTCPLARGTQRAEAIPLLSRHKVAQLYASMTLQRSKGHMLGYRLSALPI
jgi:hypothetical protein